MIGVAAALFAATIAGVPAAGAAPAGVARRPGPSGSLLIVETNRSVPLVHVVVASRTGSATDPRNREGLTNLAAECARRGAGGRSRAEIGRGARRPGATLDVRTDPDSVRFEGQVLARNLDPFLALLGRRRCRGRPSPPPNSRARGASCWPDRRAAERRSRAVRAVLRAQPLRRPPLRPPRRGDQPAARSRARRRGGGPLPPALRRSRTSSSRSPGDVTPEAFDGSSAARSRSSRAGPAPPPNPLELRNPVPPDGLAHPARRQAGSPADADPVRPSRGPRATEPDYLPLEIALTAFGGPRHERDADGRGAAQRGLAYGAYMTLWSAGAAAPSRAGCSPRRTRRSRRCSWCSSSTST